MLTDQAAGAWVQIPYPRQMLQAKAGKDGDNMKCIKGYVVEVMKSPAGYYLGTRDPEGFPNCRISGYCQSKELAPYLIPNRQTNCIENEYCNGGKGCGI